MKTTRFVFGALVSFLLKGLNDPDQGLTSAIVPLLKELDG